DFIDMEENRNNRAVEKKLKECLKNDRARIQVGRISAFGLLEMSRQRIRTGVLESSSVPCPHCAGAGLVRSTPSIALQILRALEEALIKSASHNLEVRTRPEVALYVLNQKRAHLRDLEERFNIAITVSADAALLGTRYFEVERGEFVGNENRVVPVSSLRAEAIIDEPEDEDIVEVEAEVEEAAGETEAAPRAAAADSESQESRDGRRRRRRRGGEREDGQGQHLDGTADEAGDQDEGEDGDDGAVGESDDAAPVATASPVEEPVASVSEVPAPEAETDAKPKRARRGRSKKAEAEAETETASVAKAADDAAETVAEPAEKPKRSRSRKKVVPITEDGVAAAPAEPATTPEPAVLEVAAAPEPVAEEPPPAPRVVEEPVAVVLTPPDPDRPKRGGWWNKLAGRK
ncbi:ribonuclease E/G, partial [Bosea sp. (in: a-proteobacteria)]|uniref:ribonuclease E/G n=1 Tax=Bosea sp. (in: a-proteobacteria) TaxID=1871050 RepID=UPI0025C6C701